ncbi:IS110 family transposase, partial [Frankia sp. Cpl3]|nr:IS110 family transposase [Frankia sp. Cpl3]
MTAFDDLDATDTLELLAKAPTPELARRLTIAQLSAALKRARRRDITEKSRKIRAVFQEIQLPVRPATAAAYGAVVRAQIGLISTLNAEIARLEEQVDAHFGQHPDAEILLSQPG